MTASIQSAAGTHLDFDGAMVGVAAALNLPTIELREWGERLRYCSPARVMNAFYERIESELKPFLLLGSGDFHHLSALWQRRIKEPYVLLTFDNHPDWDVRPPRWACGGWVNRALENPLVQEAQVWGCGNFELKWPNRLYANRRALAAKRLIVRPWAERFSTGDQARYACIRRENWREEFTAQVDTWQKQGRGVYVSIDLDSLVPGRAVTNWENGLFEPEDVAEALRILRQKTTVIGGDICGGYSEGRYARWTQRFVAWVDHPPLPGLPPMDERERINRQTLEILWPALMGAA